MVDTRISRAPFRGLIVLALGFAVGCLLMVIASAPAQAETGQKALVLDSSVLGGASSSEATNAAGNGFTVDVVDDATWAGMTAVQFADYQLLIVGDADSSLPQVVSQNAQALADAVMARSGANSRAGNRLLIGTDPIGHFSQGGDKLIETGIDFTGVQDGASNLYLTFSNSDPDYDGNGVPDGQDKLLPLLTVDPNGTWTQNQFPPCGGSVSLISNAAQFSTLTSANLQGWGCSDHETFPTFPTDWTALAIATDTPTAPTCGTDVDSGAAVCGEAYLLIAGSGIVVESPNLKLDPATATNPVGTTHTVTATVTNPDDSPRSGVEVSFVVTGANAGAAGTCDPADCKTDANGQVKFTYTGANEGDDTINASITVDGSRQTATAGKTWVANGGGGGGGGHPPSTCSDGLDNDHDGDSDADDAECQDPADGVEDDTQPDTCSDGEDNDNDGTSDTDDPECQDPADGIENGSDVVPAGNCASADLALLTEDLTIACVYAPPNGNLATTERECPDALIATGPGPGPLNGGVCIYLPPAQSGRS